MMGFATADGSTTGGKGGKVVTPSTLAELKQYAEDKTTPYVIRITKEFNTGVSGNSDDFDRHITYSHNWLQNILSRLPLIRFGKVHMLNNYMITSENGTNARINSDVYIEGNHYEASKKPVFGKTSENGAATFVGNKWVNCDRVPQVVLSQAPGADALSTSEEVLAGKFKPSSFYTYKADAVADVPALVKASAGVGKISTDEYGTTAVVSHEGAVDFAKIAGSSPLRLALPTKGLYVVGAGAQSQVLAGF